MLLGIHVYSEPKLASFAADLPTLLSTHCCTQWDYAVSLSQQPCPHTQQLLIQLALPIMLLSGSGAERMFEPRDPTCSHSCLLR